MQDDEPVLGASPEELSLKSFSKRAAFYTTSDNHSNPQALSELVALAAPQGDWRVLDVATGTGHLAIALAPFVISVVGLDLTPAMLEEAQRLAKVKGVININFEQGNVHALPFPDKSFELVTCRRAAHHFSDIVGALLEMRRVLKPGGRLLIEDRSVPEDDFADECMNRLDVLHDASHVREYRESEWLRLLEGVGFEVDVARHRAVRRPLAALTDGTEEPETQTIRNIVAGLDANERAVMGVEEVDGVIFTNHWFVTILAKGSDIS